jgi:hypothetical protein
VTRDEIRAVVLRALGVDVPESEYAKLATLEGAVEYLAAR